MSANKGTSGSDGPVIVIGAERSKLVHGPLGFCSSVSANGLHHLLDALHSADRDDGRGVVTVANHISVLDDPLSWGIMPTRTYFNSRHTRWALGASDIMFTNPVFSVFFRHGQVFETFRGKGVYQPAVDDAIQKLNEGNWVHLFGEGKVNQPNTYLVDDAGTAHLPRFKWGTGRIIMETQKLPTIIPMWLTGFDKIMPEPRPPPRFLPRLRKSISITFAPPLDPTLLHNVLDPWRTRTLSHTTATTDQHDSPHFDRTGGNDGGMGSGEPVGVPLGAETAEKEKTRSALTAVIQNELEKLGRKVSGPLLGRETP